MVKSANYRDWIFNFGQNEGGKDISFSINSHQFTFSSDWLLVLNFLVFETSNSGTTTAREIAHLDFIDPRTTIEVNCSHPKTWKRSSHNRHFFQQMARVNFLCVSTSWWSNTHKKNHELSFFLSNLIKAKFTIFFPPPKILLVWRKIWVFVKMSLKVDFSTIYLSMARRNHRIFWLHPLFQHTIFQLYCIAERPCSFHKNIFWHTATTAVAMRVNIS